jgi:hypothetical protein
LDHAITRQGVALVVAVQGEDGNAAINFSLASSKTGISVMSGLPLYEF